MYFFGIFQIKKKTKKLLLSDYICILKCRRRKSTVNGCADLHNRHHFPSWTGSTIAPWLKVGVFMSGRFGFKFQPHSHWLWDWKNMIYSFKTDVSICEMGIIIPISEICCYAFRSRYVWCTLSSQLNTVIRRLQLTKETRWLYNVSITLAEYRHKRSRKTNW